MAAEARVRAFDFYRGPRLVFGAGSLERLGEEASSLGRRMLLVASSGWTKSSGRADALLDSLARASLECSVLPVSGEPGPELVDGAVSRFALEGIEVVAAVGGGSAMDAGKAISAMLRCGRPVGDFLEGVGSEKHTGDKVPFIAVPTTSGSGSEATKNAVLSRVGEGGFKRSLRHDNFVPDLALVDPELMLTCPAAVTAACGMDALSQLIESYMSGKASAMTDSLALGAIERVNRNICAAHEGGKGSSTGHDTKSGTGTGVGVGRRAGGDDELLSARAEMAYAAFVSGVTLANAGLGVVHGLAGPIGALLPIPHGVVCGSLLAPLLKATVDKLHRVGQQGLPALRKLARLGWLLSPAGCSPVDDAPPGDDSPDRDPDASIDLYCGALIDRLYELSVLLGIPRLNDLGVTASDCDRIVASAGNKNNPVPLDAGEMRAVLMDRGNG